MNKPTLSDDELAIACSRAMDANDYCARALGMEIISSTPGAAILQMRITKDMTNGHGICHGGMIFSLADTAFAHACNNTNLSSVAAACSIDFIAPGKLGDTLTACAQERSRSGKTGVYDIEVTNQNDELIALFRGKSFQIRGALVDSNGDPL